MTKSLAAEGVALSEVAVLYRSNAQSRVLEHALFNAAVPYRVYGGMRFFERAEIKSALAYLRLIATPIDDGAFLRIVNFPPRGIGARTLETLVDAARTQGTSLWQVACAGGKAGGKVEREPRRVRQADRSDARRDRRPAVARGGPARQCRVRPSRALSQREGRRRTVSTISTSSSTPRRASCAKPISPWMRRCCRPAPSTPRPRPIPAPRIR